jgi:hypothetical protein
MMTVWCFRLRLRLLVRGAEVTKLVGNSPSHPGGGSSCLYQRYIYFDRNTDALLSTYFGRHFAWLKYFTYHLVPILAPNYKHGILSPAEVSFLCRNTPTDKNEVTLLSQLIFFSYYYVDKMNYCTLSSIFIYRTNIPYSFPSALLQAQGRHFVKSGPQ